MDATKPTLMLRLLSPHQMDVVRNVEAELTRANGDARIDVDVYDDLVLFSGASSDASLRRRVGQALVGVLGPVGWYDWFRPCTDAEHDAGKRA